MGAAACSGVLISMAPDAVMPALCPRAAAACAAIRQARQRPPRRRGIWATSAVLCCLHIVMGMSVGASCWAAACTLTIKRWTS
eukprot:2759164-Pyramimonas_sp.AAC.1